MISFKTVVKDELSSYPTYNFYRTWKNKEWESHIFARSQILHITCKVLLSLCLIAPLALDQTRFPMFLCCIHSNSFFSVYWNYSLPFTPELVSILIFAWSCLFCFLVSVTPFYLSDLTFLKKDVADFTRWNSFEYPTAQAQLQFFIYMKIWFLP